MLYKRVKFLHLGALNLRLYPQGDVPSWLWQRCMGNMCGMPGCWDVNPKREDRNPENERLETEKRLAMTKKNPYLETTNFLGSVKHVLGVFC